MNSPPCVPPLYFVKRGKLTVFKPPLEGIGGKKIWAEGEKIRLKRSPGSDDLLLLIYFS
jgi:hypothetical protein